MASSEAPKRKLHGPYVGSEQGTVPGHVLAEELQARTMSQGDLARKMGRPYKTVNEIINGKEIITAETALNLEAALGIPASFWTNLEQTHRLARARANRRARALVG